MFFSSSTVPSPWKLHKQSPKPTSWRKLLVSQFTSHLHNCTLPVQVMRIIFQLANLQFYWFFICPQNLRWHLLIKRLQWDYHEGQVKIRGIYEKLNFWSSFCRLGPSLAHIWGEGSTAVILWGGIVAGV